MIDLPRLIAVVRADDPAEAVEIGDALAEGGIEAVELTFTTAGAEDAIRRLAACRPGLAVGAGTITKPSQAAAAVRAGASFLVTPGSPPDLVRSLAATGLLTIAGCLTPTEIVVALDAGAHAIKIFPAGPLGPGYLAALRGPFPDVRFIPTGGIAVAEIPAWLDAGAAAVGIGGALTRGDVAAAAREAVGISRRTVA